MDTVILADHPDNNAREAAQVSETRATAPIFPPGRYGHRRAPSGRRRLLPILFLALVLAASALVTVKLYSRYGDPDYQSRIVGWTTVSDTRMTVEFAVRVPQGGTAQCALRARAYDGSAVGRATTTVSNKAATGEVRGSAEVTTTERASAGDVVRCHSAG